MHCVIKLVNIFGVNKYEKPEGRKWYGNSQKFSETVLYSSVIIYQNFSYVQSIYFSLFYLLPNIPEE